MLHRHDMSPRMRRPGQGSLAWIVIAMLSGALLSLAFACATPFVAMAVLAGTRLSSGIAVALTLSVWATNQIIGYALLDYPLSWDSFAWGGTIGLAAVLATFGARTATQTKCHPGLQNLGAFAVAFMIYEGVLFAATAILPSGDAAFSLVVIMHMAAANALALIGLLAIHQLASSIGFRPGALSTSLARG